MIYKKNGYLIKYPFFLYKKGENINGRLCF